ncbi:conjugative relaxosome accessory transposon family protein [Orientia tsutsugamushi str. TA716]|uniref:Conjugative relaxosome accessory transposon family protein n=1 Tax=Orientia tsutsugamushi str. TA716 TaxID=1359175 RepID=A0A0F3NYX0_ORITS|nr:conjugative relaxosome accessory transposon family protein [Orientia tsutsugamushi str. TA716]
MSIRIRVYVIAALFSLQALVSLAWNIENVFQGMSVNVTRSGSYQNQAAGYYVAGGLSARTSQTSFQPFAITPPSLNMSCSGIDAYLGSFSVISGEELVQLMKNIGSQAKVYAFSLGLKTFAPQIEMLLRTYVI